MSQKKSKPTCYCYVFYTTWTRDGAVCLHFYATRIRVEQLADPEVW